MSYVKIYSPLEQGPFDVRTGKKILPYKSMHLTSSLSPVGVHSDYFRSFGNFPVPQATSSVFGGLRATQKESPLAKHVQARVPRLSTKVPYSDYGGARSDLSETSSVHRLSQPYRKTPLRSPTPVYVWTEAASSNNGKVPSTRSQAPVKLPRIVNPPVKRRLNPLFDR